MSKPIRLILVVCFAITVFILPSSVKLAIAIATEVALLSLFPPTPTPGKVSIRLVFQHFSVRVNQVRS